MARRGYMSNECQRIITLHAPAEIRSILQIKENISIRHQTLTYVTVSAKTVLNGTFIITRKTDLKYSSCYGSVVLDFSHARFTV